MDTSSKNFAVCRSKVEKFLEFCNKLTLYVIVYCCNSLEMEAIHEKDSQIHDQLIENKDTQQQDITTDDQNHNNISATVDNSFPDESNICSNENPVTNVQDLDEADPNRRVSVVSTKQKTNSFIEDVKQGKVWKYSEGNKDSKLTGRRNGWHTSDLTTVFTRLSLDLKRLDRSFGPKDWKPTWILPSEGFGKMS